MKGEWGVESPSAWLAVPECPLRGGHSKSVMSDAHRTLQRENDLHWRDGASGTHGCYTHEQSLTTHRAGIGTRVLRLCWSLFRGLPSLCDTLETLSHPWAPRQVPLELQSTGMLSGPGFLLVLQSQVGPGTPPPSPTYTYTYMHTCIYFYC